MTRATLTQRRQYRSRKAGRPARDKDSKCVAGLLSCLSVPSLLGFDRHFQREHHLAAVQSALGHGSEETILARLGREVAHFPGGFEVEDGYVPGLVVEVSESQRQVASVRHV